MNDRYLWDRSGPADPDVERLERLLAPHAWRAEEAPPLALADAEAEHRAGEGRVHRPFGWPAVWIGGASLAAGLLAVLFLRPDPGGTTSDVLAGSYRVHGVAGRDLVRVGEELRVAEGTATVEIAEIGEVALAAGSRLSVQAASDSLHRLYLAEGDLEARIWAPPKLFQVDTPAGLTVDLGCEYRLTVAADGTSTLRVDSGQVAFEFDGREVYVPAGAACVSLPERGPGAPLFDDASAAFRRAVGRVEFDPEPDPADVAVVAAIDRREDGLTLVHLLDAPSAELRRRVLERLGQIFPKPPGVTDVGLGAGDREMRAAWMETMKPFWRVY